jgi:hypothetical protein
LDLFDARFMDVGHKVAISKNRVRSLEQKSEAMNRPYTSDSSRIDYREWDEVCDSWPLPSLRIRPPQPNRIIK